jgi:hypothetical protein
VTGDFRERRAREGESRTHARTHARIATDRNGSRRIATARCSLQSVPCAPWRRRSGVAGYAMAEAINAAGDQRRWPRSWQRPSNIQASRILKHPASSSSVSSEAPAGYAAPIAAATKAAGGLRRRRVRDRGPEATPSPATRMALRLASGGQTDRGSACVWMRERVGVWGGGTGTNSTAPASRPPPPPPPPWPFFLLRKWSITQPGS